MKTNHLHLMLSQTELEIIQDGLGHKEDERGLSSRLRTFVLQKLKETTQQSDLKQGVTILAENLNDILVTDKSCSQLTKERLKSSIYGFAAKYSVGEQLKLNF